MSKYQEYLKKMKEQAEIRAKNPELSAYEVERLGAYVEALFTFSKFEIGENVALAKKFPITAKESWGWLAYKHLFAKGALATVRDVDYYNNSFQYSIVFKEKSWIDSNGNLYYNSSKDGAEVVFTMAEKWLKCTRKKF